MHKLIFKKFKPDFMTILLQDFNLLSCFQLNCYFGRHFNYFEKQRKKSERDTPLKKNTPKNSKNYNLKKNSQW